MRRTDPQIQNIPIRTEEGRKMKQALAAQLRTRQGPLPDYTSIEERILSHSKSPTDK